MTTILFQIAPQRSTQYADLTAFLAPIELQLSPIRDRLRSIQPGLLGGQQYLQCEIEGDLSDAQRKELGYFATTSGYFNYFEQLGTFDGPFLQPIETGFEPAFPLDLITARRYKGKTNELFTHFMCNLARFSSHFAEKPWSQLRVFDPLAGGGTTLFVALALGAEAIGIEQNKKTTQLTATFLKQYLQEKRISYSVKEERLRKHKAHRWLFNLKKGQTRCTLAQGEIVQTKHLLGGVKQPHLIVCDLPYGIQHKGGLEDLLLEALPIWEKLLAPGGVLVFSWDATRFSWEKMGSLVAFASDLHVLDMPPYTTLGHRVDRVIKNRNLIVAQRLLQQTV
ncbi:MAG: TRM11 family SAM-dependent methyltransferase [Candidatus Promineifilaceae bacterium]